MARLNESCTHNFIGNVGSFPDVGKGPSHTRPAVSGSGPCNALDAEFPALTSERPCAADAAIVVGGRARVDTKGMLIIGKGKGAPLPGFKVYSLPGCEKDPLAALANELETFLCGRSGCNPLLPPSPCESLPPAATMRELDVGSVLWHRSAAFDGSMLSGADSAIKDDGIRYDLANSRIADAGNEGFEVDVASSLGAAVGAAS